MGNFAENLNLGKRVLPPPACHNSTGTIRVLKKQNKTKQKTKKQIEFRPLLFYTFAIVIFIK